MEGIDNDKSILSSIKVFVGYQYSKAEQSFSLFIASKSSITACRTSE
jgi:hypothetical protein